jgi:Icc-related predicted phosphoesterase
MPAKHIHLLLFSDLHADLVRGRELVRRARDVDLLIGAGDIGHLRRRLPETIAVLREIETPTVLVAGNSESFEELEAACRGWDAAHVLHGSGTTLCGIPVWGVGGAIPVTPFGSWSYDLTEEEGAALLAECPRGAILVSHSPPKGTLDVSSSGTSLGSTAVREAVLRVRPRLVICGHIHDSSGQSSLLDGIPVVNAGPDGMDWELDA